MRADVIPFPAVLRHWPADFRKRGQLPPLSAFLVWREARDALFAVCTDEHGVIVEVWPVAYCARPYNVQALAQGAPVYRYLELAADRQAPPAARRRGAA